MLMSLGRPHDRPEGPSSIYHHLYIAAYLKHHRHHHHDDDDLMVVLCLLRRAKTFALKAGDAAPPQAGAALAGAGLPARCDVVIIRPSSRPS